MVEKLKWCMCMCVLPLALGADVLPGGWSDPVSQAVQEDAVPEDAKLSVAASDEAWQLQVEDEGEGEDEHLDFTSEDPDFDYQDDEDGVSGMDDDDIELSFAEDESASEPFYQGLVVPNTGRYKNRYPYKLVRDSDPNVTMALLDAPSFSAQHSLQKMVQEKKVVSFKGDLMRHGDTGEFLVLHANLAEDITVIP